MHVGEVDVGEGDGAAVGQIAGRGDLLGDRADEILRGDHRRVVGAGDGDVDLLGDQAAVLVVERDGEALDLGLAGGQILDRGVGNRVGPGQLAAGCRCRWCRCP